MSWLISYMLHRLSWWTSRLMIHEAKGHFYVTYSQGSVGEDPDKTKTFMCSANFSLSITAAEIALGKKSYTRQRNHLFICTTKSLHGDQKWGAHLKLKALLHDYSEEMFWLSATLYLSPPKEINEAAIIRLRMLSYQSGITVIKMGHPDAPSLNSFVVVWRQLKHGGWQGRDAGVIIQNFCTEQWHAMLIASRGIFNKYFTQRSIITT